MFTTQAKIIMFSIVAAIVLTIGASVTWKVVSFLNHVHQLEAENSRLNDAYQKITTEYDKVLLINHNNEQVLAAQQAATEKLQQIAAENARKTAVLEAKYRSIRDEAAHYTPDPACPVDPVISHTVDRLWGQDSGSTSHSDQGPLPGALAGGSTSSVPVPPN